MSWDILPKNNLQYFLQKLKAKFDGKADNSDVTETDTPNSTPFLYRETPYEADGVFLDELVGGSVAWNQLVQNGNFADGSHWTGGSASLSVVNNEATITLTGSDWNNDLRTTDIQLTANRVYLAVFKYKMTSGLSNFHLRIGIGSSLFVNYVGYSSTYKQAFVLIKPETISYNLLRISLSENGTSVSGQSFYIKEFNLCDITQMFGATIADYIYSLEQATAGSGIAWLKSHGFFTKDYYPYNAGELISVKTSGKKYVGKNIFGGEWNEEFALHISAGTIFTISCKKENVENQKRFYVYDENDTLIDYWGLTSETETRLYRTFNLNYDIYYVKFGYSVATEMQIEYGNQLTQFEPYTEKIYPISNIDLRGIPKLVNNELVYDGDIYESNGDVTRKYGIVDLGSLAWSYASGEHSRMEAGFSLIKNNDSAGNVAVNIVCEKYISESSNNVYNHTADKIIGHHKNLGRLWIYDSAYTDATTFKSAMSGVYLIYELATPTTETADPYTNPQICDKDGTEEWIDDRTVPVPVGHNSTYANLPSMMDGDFLNYMVDNFATKEYTDRVVETKGGVQKTVIFDDLVRIADEITLSLPSSYNFLVFEVNYMYDGATGSAIYSSLIDSINIPANYSGTSHWMELRKAGDIVSVRGDTDIDQGGALLKITVF